MRRRALRSLLPCLVWGLSWATAFAQAEQPPAAAPPAQQAPASPAEPPTPAEPAPPSSEPPTAPTAGAPEATPDPAPGSESAPEAAPDTVSDTETETGSDSESVSAPESESESESASESAPAPAADPAPAAEPPPAELPPPAPESAAIVAVGPAFGILNLPRFGAGMSALLRIDTRWPIEVGFSFWFDNQAEIEPEDRDLGLHPLLVVPFPEGGSRATFRLFTGNVAVCPHEVAMRSGRLWACGGVYAGSLSSEAEGFGTITDESRGLFGLEVYARWQYHVAGPISLTYSAGLFVPLVRDRFVYENRFGSAVELFQQSVVGGRIDFLIGMAL